MNWPGKQASLTALITALVMLALSSCSGGDPVFQPTMTQQQASARVEQILRETAAAITPQPRLEIYEPGSHVIGCLVNPSDTADTRVQATRRYFLQNVPKSATASVGEQILHLWKQRGYAIDNTLGMGTSSPEIHGATGDDFLIALEVSGAGLLSIGATSPCVWPDGTPPPGH